MKNIPDDFDWEFYLYLNKDLRESGLYSKEEAIEHYLQWGKNEKRKYKKIHSNKFSDEIINIQCEKFVHSQDYKVTKNHNLEKCEVSVIISLYNYQNYIYDAVRSVINNDFIDLEIVIIDDKSTDNSLKIAKSFLNSKNSFTIIEKKSNTGLVDTRNIGLSNCVGDFVFILDADNQIYSNCLREHLKCLKQNEKAIACYSKIDCFDIKNNWVKYISDDFLDFDKLKFANYVDAMAMFNKKKLIEIGGYSTELSKFSVGWEDYELWLRIQSLKLDVFFIDLVLSKYLIKQDSMLSFTNSEDNKSKLVSFLNKKYKTQIL